MLAVIIGAFALVAPAPTPSPYMGPPPTAPYWRELVAKAHLQPLAPPGSLRLIRLAEALLPVTVVSVIPTAEGAHVDVRVIQDRRKVGASVRTRALSQDRFDILRTLAAEGLWKQSETAPTGKPGVVDGVDWYIEGVRDHEHWAIVRHEPADPAVRALCREFMDIIGAPEKAPSP
jgi:hypothetical protein